MMPQIEEDIEGDGNEKEIDGERKADDTKDDNTCRRKIAQKYARLRYKLQTIVNIL